MGKEIFITGANSTIGVELVRNIVNNYDKIICHYAHEKREINILEKNFLGKIVSVQADLSDEEQIKNMLEFVKKNELAPTHFVHLAAPRVNHIKFAKSTLEPFKNHLQITYMSFVQICQMLLPKMIKEKSGKIITMLTSYTVTEQPSYMSDYISAKYALLGLVKSLATEYSGKNIQINAVSPEMMDTNYIKGIPSYIIENTIKNRSTGRLLSVMDVVPIFKWLLSDDANSITGQNVLIP